MPSFRWKRGQAFCVAECNRTESGFGILTNRRFIQVPLPELSGWGCRGTGVADVRSPLVHARVYSGIAAPRLKPVPGLEIKRVGETATNSLDVIAIGAGRERAVERIAAAKAFLTDTGVVDFIAQRATGEISDIEIRLRGYR